MDDLAELISSKIHKAQDGDSRSYKLNKGIAIIAKFGFQLLGSKLDQSTVCGSSRDGLKLSIKGDIGDIDFMITNSESVIENKIEETKFIYDKKFPCHCKILVDGKFVTREMMLSGTSPLSIRLYEIADLESYNKVKGGIQGYQFFEWLNKLPEIFKCIYLLKRAIQTTRGKLTQGNGTTETDLKEKLNIWEEEYSVAETEQFLHIGFQFIGLFSVVLDTSEPEKDITKFLSDILHEDTINTNESSLKISMHNMMASGSSLQRKVIEKLMPHMMSMLSGGAPFPKKVIAESLSDLMPKFSVDWIAAFDVSGWPTPANEWICRDRNWPSKDIVQTIARGGFNLVGKPSPEPELVDEEWYLSFARAEIKLCESLNEVQKLCYLASKILVKYGVESAVDDDEKHKDYNIKSYFLRTAFLWVCECVDPADWTNDKLPKNLDTVLNFLIKAYRSKNLPHYFVPEMNLLGRTEDETCYSISDKLSKIISNVPDCFHELFQRKGEFVVYDAIV